MKSQEQFNKAFDICEDLFISKFNDYGASWRILRPESLTDQIYIKANRIRSLEIKESSKVNEGILGELIAIVNYGIIGLIQLELSYANDDEDMSLDKVLGLYEKYRGITEKLFNDKNHDYDEAWRLMRVSSYTDLILMKINRTKQIEDNKGKTLVSEGIDANYMDMINYALFYMIKLSENA